FFTQYLLSQTAQLKSVYSSRLYELLIQWRSTEKTPIINLEDFRAQLGIEENQYKLMSDFKKRILDLAINDINEKTDIKVTYQQHKKGRSISGFSFNFKQKKSAKQSVESRRDQNTLDIFSKMTDKQRHLFANKLSELPEMGQYSEGTESYQQFALRIAEMLQDSLKFQELFPYLQKVGYQAA
ncbi:MAG: replication initiation protein RepM, partial [Paludibacteraceae bacterium]|nr:replication initiation protein RepM [Paludibacteraceae bacterium]